MKVCCCKLMLIFFSSWNIVFGNKLLSELP